MRRRNLSSAVALLSVLLAVASAQGSMPFVPSSGPGNQPLRLPLPPEFTNAAITSAVPVGVAPSFQQSSEEKPGSCPDTVSVRDYGWCVSHCRTDMNCTYDQKCCFNGCGTMCMHPADDSDALVMAGRQGYNHQELPRPLTELSQERNNPIPLATLPPPVPQDPFAGPRGAVTPSRFSSGAQVIFNTERPKVGGGFNQVQPAKTFEQYQHQCPPTNYLPRSCEVQCNSDSDCGGSQAMQSLCCSSGCGKLCVTYTHGSEHKWEIGKASTFANRRETANRLDSQPSTAVEAELKVLPKTNEKPGSCPSLGYGTGGCVQTCSHDQDCEYYYKCCSNGCTMRCVRPVFASQDDSVLPMRAGMEAMGMVPTQATLPPATPMTPAPAPSGELSYNNRGFGQSNELYGSQPQNYPSQRYQPPHRHHRHPPAMSNSRNDAGPPMPPVTLSWNQQQKLYQSPAPPPYGPPSNSYQTPAPPPYGPPSNSYQTPGPPPYRPPGNSYQTPAPPGYGPPNNGYPTQVPPGYGPLSNAYPTQEPPGYGPPSNAFPTQGPPGSRPQNNAYPSQAPPGYGPQGNRYQTPVPPGYGPPQSNRYQTRAPPPGYGPQSNSYDMTKGAPGYGPPSKPQYTEPQVPFVAGTLGNQKQLGEKPKQETQTSLPYVPGMNIGARVTRPSYARPPEPPKETFRERPAGNKWNYEVPRQTRRRRRRTTTFVPFTAPPTTLPPTTTTTTTTTTSTTTTTTRPTTTTTRPTTTTTTLPTTPERLVEIRPDVLAHQHAQQHAHFAIHRRRLPVYGVAPSTADALLAQQGVVVPETCIVHNQTRLDPQLFTMVGSYLQIFTSMPITCTGQIVAWQFVRFAVEADAAFHASVWRRVNTRKLEFELIGSNRIVAGKDRYRKWKTWVVPRDQRIDVKMGQFIGVFYDDVNISEAQMVVPYLDPSLFPNASHLVEAGVATETDLREFEEIKLVSNGLVRVTFDYMWPSWRLPALVAYVLPKDDADFQKAVPTSNTAAFGEVDRFFSVAQKRFRATNRVNPTSLSRRRQKVFVKEKPQPPPPPPPVEYEDSYEDDVLQELVEQEISSEVPKPPPKVPRIFAMQQEPLEIGTPKPQPRPQPELEPELPPELELEPEPELELESDPLRHPGHLHHHHHHHHVHVQTAKGVVADDDYDGNVVDDYETPASEEEAELAVSREEFQHEFAARQGFKHEYPPPMDDDREEFKREFTPKNRPREFVPRSGPNDDSKREFAPRDRKALPPQFGTQPAVLPEVPTNKPTSFAQWLPKQEQLMAGSHKNGVVPGQCLEMVDPGRCHTQLIRYYYDASLDVCKPFIYTGCGGNSNNFKTQVECEQSCIVKRRSQAPSAPPPPPTSQQLPRGLQPNYMLHDQDGRLGMVRSIDRKFL